MADFPPVKESGWTPWIRMKMKHKHECCDCKLEHWVEYRTVDGVIEERWKRDNRATANKRRKK